MSFALRSGITLHCLIHNLNVGGVISFDNITKGSLDVVNLECIAPGGFEGGEPQLINVGNDLF